MHVVEMIQKDIRTNGNVKKRAHSIIFPKAGVNIPVIRGTIDSTIIIIPNCLWRRVTLCGLFRSPFFTNIHRLAKPSNIVTIKKSDESDAEKKYYKLINFMSFLNKVGFLKRIASDHKSSWKYFFCYVWFTLWSPGSTVYINFGCLWVLTWSDIIPGVISQDIRRHWFSQ